MFLFNRLKASKQGQALIGLLIALAIIVSVIAAIYGGGMNKGVYGGAIIRADQTACGEYTGQIHQAIMMYRQDYEHNPPNLQALSKYGVTADMYNAPGCSYTYDPNTGRLFAPDNSRPGQTAPVQAATPPAAPPPSYQGNSTPPAPAPVQTYGQPANQDGGGAQQGGGSPATTVVGPGGMTIRVPTGP